MNQLHQHIEALIFCSEQSLGIQEIAASLKLSYGWELSEEEIVSAAAAIREKYLGEEFAFELVEISEGYQFLTKKDYFPTVNALIQHKAKKRLSVAQMETLSIIAYRQPISKPEIERIRGVNCDYAIQKLLEKELISISGKSEGAGRPILYSTSDSFMDYFGIKSVKDLPQLKDIQTESNEIGMPLDASDNAADDSIESVMTEQEVTIEAETASYDEVSMTSMEEESGSRLVEESELPVPDRRQIFMENLENPSEEEQSAAEESDDENIGGNIA
jgi:segregation and condensation protein B